MGRNEMFVISTQACLSQARVPACVWEWVYKGCALPSYSESRNQLTLSSFPGVTSDKSHSFH